MIFYLLIFLISTLLIHVGSRSTHMQQKFFYLIGILIPSLVAAFRGLYVGTDTFNYVDRYSTFAAAEGIKAMITVLDTEVFFLVACFIGKYIGGSIFVLFIYSFVMQLFLVLTLNKFKKKICVWLGYILFLFFFYNASLNIMRQMLALPYIVYATTMLLEGKKKRFYILAIVSMTLHITAIVACIFVYIIYRVSSVSKRKKKIVYFLYIVGIFISFFLVNIVMAYMVAIDYGNSYAYISGAANSVVGSTDVAYSIVLIYVSYKAMRQRLITTLSPDFYYLSSIACLMLFLTGYYNQWLARMAYYMLAFSCLYLPMLAVSPKLHKYNQLYKAGIFSFGFAYWLYLIVISGSNATIPYSTMTGFQFNF